jgi:hypothetical protein
MNNRRQTPRKFQGKISKEIARERAMEKIIQGTHVNQSSDWDYEGVMTVGEYTTEDEDSVTYKGFSDGNSFPVFGVLADYNGFIIFIFEEYGVVAVVKLEGENAYYIDKLEINGVLFENGIDAEGTYFLTETDPFTAVGQTCIIKVKKSVAL